MTSQGECLASYQSVGPSLVATRTYACGEEVLCDTPFVEWDAARSNLGEDVEEWMTEFQIPRFFGAAACALWPILSNPESDSATILSKMHAPDLPIGLPYLQLAQFAQLFVAKEKPSGQRMALTASLIRAIMAAKVNSHRGPSGLWCLLPTGSKLAHSCEPNLYYQPRIIASKDNEQKAQSRFSFIALRSIAAGELLSFSYLGGPLLLMPASYRQQRLKASHLFVCVCERCRGADKPRSFRCPECYQGSFTRRTSPMLVSTYDAYPMHGPLWLCNKCQFSAYHDADASLDTLTTAAVLWQPWVTPDVLAVEQELGKEVEAYSGGQSEGSPTATKSLSYPALLSHLAKAEGHLGMGHHITRDLAQLLANYFRLMCQQGQALRARALGPYIGWALRSMCLAERHHDIRCWPRWGEKASQVHYPHMMATRQLLAICEQLIPSLQRLLLSEMTSTPTDSVDGEKAFQLALLSAALSAVLPMAIATSAPGENSSGDLAPQPAKLKSFTAIQGMLKTISDSCSEDTGNTGSVGHWVHYGIIHAPSSTTLSIFSALLCSAIEAAKLACHGPRSQFIAALKVAVLDDDCLCNASDRTVTDLTPATRELSLLWTVL